jgi:hypothetical protein
MLRGQLVTVVDAWGKRLKRKVVIASNQKVWVCKPEEFEEALRENREPCAIGFPREDVKLSRESQE